MTRSPEPPAAEGRHVVALRAAAKRIKPARRRISLDEADRVVRSEFKRQGIELTPRSIRQHALLLHSKPITPLLHPIRARRAGWTWRS